MDDTVDLEAELERGAKLSLSGFGEMGGRFGQSSLLLTTHNLELISLDDCQERWLATAALHDGYLVPDGQICVVASANTTTGACTGDSGGPLTLETGDGAVQLVGLASWGHVNCENLVPGSQLPAPDAYTNILHYRQWIRTTIRGSNLADNRR